MAEVLLTLDIHWNKGWGRRWHSVTTDRLLQWPLVWLTQVLTGLAASLFSSLFHLIKGRFIKLILVINRAKFSQLGNTQNNLIVSSAFFFTRPGNYRSWSIFMLRFTYSVYISCCYFYFSKSFAILILLAVNLKIQLRIMTPGLIFLTSFTYIAPKKGY